MEEYTINASTPCITSGLLITIAIFDDQGGGEELELPAGRLCQSETHCTKNVRERNTLEVLDFNTCLEECRGCQGLILQKVYNVCITLVGSIGKLHDKMVADTLRVLEKVPST